MKIYLPYGIGFLKTMEFLRLGSIFHFHHFSRVTPAAGAIWATAPLPLAVGARWATSGSWSLMLLSGLVDIKSEIHNFRKDGLVEVVGRSLFWDIVKICNLG